VLGRALLLTGSGIVIGSGAALYASRLFSHLIFGVSDWDPASYVYSAGVLVIAGLSSAYFPALQASRMNAAAAGNSAE
jgi:ABC-type antimicrobial peptide transport system permease subunit